MSRTATKPAWETGFRAAARVSPGWTVTRTGSGKIRLQVRKPGQKADGCVLPLDWAPGNVNRALQLVGRIYKLVEGGQQTVKGAMQVATAGSDTMRFGTDWRTAAEGLRKTRMDGHNEISQRTWERKYLRYISEALSILEGHEPPTDGHGLLQLTLRRWAGKPTARVDCCNAIRALTDHAIARHRAPACWRIDRASITELRGKPASKRIKATLDDEDLRWLIEGIEKRNPGWANVLRLMTLYGLRPIELQHLVPKTDENGVLRMWCGYRKTCGAQQTDPRWLMPAPLTVTGEVQEWNLVGAMYVGLLKLPPGRDGGMSRIDGHHVSIYLGRQPEWGALRKKCEARGEWLRPYAFRDSYSLRCHRHGIEIGAVAAAMGHSVAVHSSSYRWASQQTTAAEFERAFQGV